MNNIEVKLAVANLVETAAMSNEDKLDALKDKSNHAVMNGSRLEVYNENGDKLFTSTKDDCISKARGAITRGNKRAKDTSRQQTREQKEKDAWANGGDPNRSKPRQGNKRNPDGSKIAKRSEFEDALSDQGNTLVVSDGKLSVYDVEGYYLGGTSNGDLVKKAKKELSDRKKSGQERRNTVSRPKPKPKPAPVGRGYVSDDDERLSPRGGPKALRAKGRGYGSDEDDLESEDGSNHLRKKYPPTPVPRSKPKPRPKPTPKPAPVGRASYEDDDEDISPRGGPKALRAKGGQRSEPNIVSTKRIGYSSGIKTPRYKK